MRKDKECKETEQDFKNISTKKQQGNYTRHYSFGFITGDYN